MEWSQYCNNFVRRSMVTIFMTANISQWCNCRIVWVHLKWVITRQLHFNSKWKKKKNESDLPGVSSIQHKGGPAHPFISLSFWEDWAIPFLFVHSLWHSPQYFTLRCSTNICELNWMQPPRICIWMKYYLWRAQSSRNLGDFRSLAGAVCQWWAHETPLRAAWNFPDGIGLK